MRDATLSEVTTVVNGRVVTLPVEEVALRRLPVLASLAAPIAEEVAAVKMIAGIVADGTIGEVLDVVGDDPNAAAVALRAELGGKGRKTLISKLEKLAGG